MVVGHREQLALLEKDLPPVSLFLGPQSVGKWTVAEHLRRHHEILDSDVLRIHILSRPLAREAEHFASMSPVGEYRLAIIRIDTADEGALHFLLKALEESSSTTKFILIATTPTLVTISSRAFVFRFDYLADEEVAEVLVQRNFTPVTAQKLSTRSGGQVLRAIESKDSQDARAAVLSALRAFREKDSSILEKSASGWTDEHTELLSTWAREAFTGRWRVFTEAEGEIDDKKLPMKILIALRANIRPRLVVRSSLMNVLKGMTV